MVDWIGTTIRLEGRDISSGFRLDRATDNPIDFVLELNRSTGTVNGSVVNNRMEPAPNVTVVLIPDARGAWKNALTDADGNFQITSVAPGDYKLYAWEDVELYAWQSPDFMRDYIGRGKAIHIDDGGKANAQVTVIPYSPKN